MALVPQLSIVGVASPYAWDIVESAHRLGSVVTCVDNYGGAALTLPSLEVLSESTDRSRPFTIGLSSAAHRGATLANAAEAGFTTPWSLIDPTAILASTTTIGHCVYVNAGVVVGSNTTIGCGSNINRSASIGHDNAIGFSASVAPGAVLAGGITLGDYATVGTGATILPGVSIGRGATVGAGAVVTRSMAEFEVVVGNPARLLRVNPIPTELTLCPYCSPHLSARS